MSDFKQTERESQSLLVAEALWLVQKRLRMGKDDWETQVLIPILYVRATLPLQFLVLKSGSSGSRTIHARDNPHKG